MCGFQYGKLVTIIKQTAIIKLKYLLIKVCQTIKIV